MEAEEGPGRDQVKVNTDGSAKVTPRSHDQEETRKLVKYLHQLPIPPLNHRELQGDGAPLKN